MINLLFDVDDTLYDQLKPFEDAYREVFNHLGFDLPIDQLFVKSRYYSEEVFELVNRGVMDTKDMHVYRVSKAFESMGIEISREEALLFQSSYEQNQEGIVIVPEMVELMNFALSKEINIGIITNGPAGHQEKKIKQLQLIDWIEEKNIFISGKLGISKPDIKIFNYVENQMGISPEQSYFIGDSFDNDVVGAKQAGWNSIWINRRNHQIPPDAKYMPDYIVDDYCSCRGIWDIIMEAHNVPQ